MTWDDTIGKDFRYNVGINGAYNKNKVGKIPTEDGIIHGSTNQLYDNTPEFYRAENGSLSAISGVTRLPVFSRTIRR